MSRKILLAITLAILAIIALARREPAQADAKPADTNVVEFRDPDGNRTRIVNREPTEDDHARTQKLAAMTPDEQKAFLAEEFSAKAAARSLDRVRSKTPEQRVDELRERGKNREQVILRPKKS